MDDELYEALLRFNREVLKPEFEEILSSMLTKADMAEHMECIHQRFDRLEEIMRG
ncbi:MAG TPA: hypothetical protein VGA84_11970 [Thermoanaerobaculia bacterium]